MTIDEAFQILTTSPNWHRLVGIDRRKAHDYKRGRRHNDKTKRELLIKSGLFEHTPERFELKN